MNILKHSVCSDLKRQQVAEELLFKAFVQKYKINRGQANSFHSSQHSVHYLAKV
jgi:hypothetical protein